MSDNNTNKGIVVTISDQPSNNENSGLLMETRITTQEHPDGFTVAELLGEMLKYYNDTCVLEPSFILERPEGIFIVFDGSNKVTTVLGFIEYIVTSFKNSEINTRGYHMRQMFNVRKVHVNFDGGKSSNFFKLTNLKGFFV